MLNSKHVGLAVQMSKFHWNSTKLAYRLDNKHDVVKENYYIFKNKIYYYFFIPKENVCVVGC
jgi:hypothetical protein